MSWTAKLKAVKFANGVATIIYTLTDGNSTFDKTWQGGSPGDSLLEKLVAQDVRNLEAMQSYVDGLQARVDQTITPFDYSPTPEQAAANDFFALVAKLKALQTAVTNGTAKPDDPSAELQSQIKTALGDHPEYLDDPRWR